MRNLIHYIHSVGYKTDKPRLVGDRLIVPVLEDVEMPLAAEDFRRVAKRSDISHLVCFDITYEGNSIVFSPSVSKGEEAYDNTFRLLRLIDKNRDTYARTQNAASELKKPQEVCSV